MRCPPCAGSIAAFKAARNLPEVPSARCRAIYSDTFFQLRFGFEPDLLIHACRASSGLPDRLRAIGTTQSMQEYSDSNKEVAGTPSNAPRAPGG